MSLRRFSSLDIPEKDRVAVMLDVYAAIEQVDVQLTGDDAVHGETAVRALPNLTILKANCTPCISRRTRKHVVDGKDDLVLSVITGGRVSFSRNGGEAEFLQPGDAYLGLNDRASEHRLVDDPAFIDIAISREVLAPGIADLDKASRSKLPESAELTMLINYAHMLTAETGDLKPEAEASCSSHVLDLAVMAIGATRDAAEAANAGGVRAARLKAIQSDIAANISRPDLSVRTVARRHGISPQYVRSLFNAEGTTFSTYVMDERLAFAYRLLTDRRLAEYRISAIAFEAGFGDLSYFNRSFRRHYGMTPSDARAVAGLSGNH
mgnify:CR=1 FL=1